MNQEIRAYLENYNIENGYGTSDEELIETLCEEEEVYRKPLTKHRWWTDIFVVVDVGGKLIGYDWAETTGDNSPQDVGWEFDQRSICEVKSREVVKTVYEKI